MSQVNEECKCPVCELIDETVDSIVEAKHVSDLFAIVEETVQRAMMLGERDAIIDDINEKIAYVQAIDESLECGKTCDCESKEDCTFG